MYGLGHTTRMKKSFGIIFIVGSIIFAIADTIHSLVANDAFHYFSEQPSRLLLVAAIGIAGGLIALCFFYCRHEHSGKQNYGLWVW